MRCVVYSKKIVKLVLLAFALLSCHTVSPYQADSSKWWNKHDEGWFFYNEAIEPEPEKEQKTVAPLLYPIPPNAPQPLFSESMKKRGEELLSRAMENPIMENVKAYMEHNQKMLALSKNFSLVWQRVLMSHPELLSGTPVSDSDKDIYFKQTAKEKKEALERLSADAGLLFIYDTTCPYCVRQAKYLKMFIDEHPSFIVKAVTMNGEIVAEFPDSVKDNGISARLNVTEHPAIFLMYPPDRFERVSTGLITPDELKDKLLLLQMPDASPAQEDPFGNLEQTEATKGGLPLLLTGK